MGDVVSAEKDVGRMERLRRWVCSWWGHDPFFYEEWGGTVRGICLRCGETPPCVTSPDMGHPRLRGRPEGLPMNSERDALDEVERRVRALKRVGDPATHETVVQVVLSIVDEVRGSRVLPPDMGQADD